MDQTAYFNGMRERRRREILAMAKEMFLTEDPKSFTMQNLARRLDISTVTLYKYFKNSDAVIDAVVRSIYEEDKLRMMEVSREGDVLDQVMDTLALFFRRMHENRRENALLFLFDSHTRAIDRSPQEKDFAHHMEALLLQGQREGMIRTDSSPKELWQFLVQTNLAVVQRVSLLDEEEYQRTKPEIEQWTNRLLAMVRCYLAG